MPFSRKTPTLALLLVGLALCAVNVWFAAVRSTIPISLEGRVKSHQLLIEHARGLDDVCLLTLDDGQTIHVDKPVYEAVSVGDRVRKSRWSFGLHHGDRVLALEWSRDARRMAWVMPLALLVLAILFRFAVANPSPQNLSVEAPGTGS